MPAVNEQSPRSTPLPAVLALTFLCSVSTGVFWSGVPFIAKQEYHFSQQRNLVLSALMGFLYVVFALGVGPLSRRIEAKVSHRSLIAGILTLQGSVCLLPVLLPGREIALWIAAGAVSCLSAMLWPPVESYMSAGRHGRGLRNAIGIYNVTWTVAVAVAMWLLAPLLEKNAAWGIGGMGVINFIAMTSLIWFAPMAGHHESEPAGKDASAEYPLLLQASRALLPVSYLFVAAMGPIMPYRLDALGVDLSWQTPITATWMTARIAVLILMWQIGFWHGRWGTLLLGALAQTGGFAMILLAPNLPMMIAGLTVFGLGVGILYYASLYYAMTVGNAAVDAGGVFEALIGLGYTVGPLAGLAGASLGGPVVSGDAMVVGIVWSLVALGAIPAVLPYVKARSIRSAAARSG